MDKLAGMERRHGPRPDLVRVLEELAEGWWHLAKDRNAREAREGVARLLDGQPSVRVGHTVYEVTEHTH